ncbi:hypothetical protein IW141_005165, partial [Coemansia sp. RSA 355]
MYNYNTLKPEPPSAVQIGFGSNNLTQQTHVKAQEIYLHPQFDPTNTSNDIALVIINPINEFNESVKPAVIYNGELPQGLELVAVGWGLTSASGTSDDLPDQLQQTFIVVGERAECRKLIPDYESSNGPQICTQNSLKPGADTCQGDSGTGVFVTNNGTTFLAGLTSFGASPEGDPTCALNNGLAVYTHVFYYREFLEQFAGAVQNGRKRPIKHKKHKRVELEHSTFSSSDDNDDGDYDDGNDDDDDNYDDGASAASQYRFWATRPPHIPAPARNTQSRQSSSQSGSLEDALDRKSQLVVRRPAGGTSGDSTGLENVMATYAALQLRTEVPGVMGRDHQSRILFVSLLENYCRTYDDDPLRNRRLFFAICRTLYSMGIVGKEYVDEMSAIRATYSDAFRQLVVRAQASLDGYERHDIETGIRSLMNSVAEGSGSLNPESSYSDEWSVSHSNAMPFEQPPQNTFDVESSSDSDSSDGVFSSTDSNNQSAYRSYSNHASTRSNATTAATANDAHRLRRSSRAGSTVNTFETMMMDVQRSRYHDDFIQLRCLGKGGFGKVYEVRNKLDGRPYAVKHIRIKGEITAEKTLREIKTLANLDHPNIVRYYSSWIEVARLRKRTSGNRNDTQSTSPFRALYGMPPKPRQPEQSAAFGGFDMELSGEPFTFDSPRSSLSDAWQDDSGNPFDSATGISVTSASPGNSYDGAEFSFEDSFNNGEAFVMAEVSIGHTNESYDQRQEAVNSIVFEQSVGGACADVSNTADTEIGPDRAANAQSCPPAFNVVSSPEQSICANEPLLSAGIKMPAPIPIRPGVRHQRQRSMHTASDAQCARDAHVNRRSMSVLSTLSGQAQSLPSQVLAGIDLVQPFVAETTLFVQMQL